MDKNNKFVVFLLFLILINPGCSHMKNNNETNDNQVIENNEEKNDESVPTTKVEKEDNIKNVEKLSKWTDNSIKKTKYKISSGSCKIKSMAAPAYVDRNKIIFIDDLEDSDSIISFDRNTETCAVIYKTKGIGNLTTIEEKLFWTEYDTKKMTEVNWKIKSVDLNTRKVITISNGGSFQNTPTPTLRTADNSITWIEYEANEAKRQIKSKLMSYDLKTKNITVINNEILDEKDESDGEYYILQHNKNDEQYLIYKTKFKKGNKEFDLSFVKDKTINSVSNENGIIDFTFRKNKVVYTSERYVTIVNTKNSEKMIFDTKDASTTDTPIFLNDEVMIFRYSISDIYILDVRKGTTSSITDSNISTSKPIYTNELVAYGVFSSDGDFNSLDFYVVEIK